MLNINSNIGKYFILLGRLSFIKTLYYSVKFKAIVVVGKNCRIILPRLSTSIKGKVMIGINYYSSEKTVLINRGICELNGPIEIMRGSKIIVDKGASININSFTYLNENTKLRATNKISIGKKCAISWNCNIIDSDLHDIYCDSQISNPSSPIIIGDNVLIGMNSVILKGVSIKEGSIISAGTIVRNSFDEKGIIYSHDTKCIKKINMTWN